MGLCAMKLLWLSLLAPLLSSFPAFGQTPSAPLRLADSIPIPHVEGRIDHFTIDLQHHTVFIAALGANAVAAIDLVHGKELGRITGLKQPQGLLYVPDNRRLYIANGGDGSVRIYDASSLKQLKSVELGDDADNIRYDPVAKTVWVGYGSGSVAGLSLDGNKLIDIPVGEHPESFQLEGHGSKLFLNVPRKKEVAVIDSASKKVIATYPTGSATGNYPMAFDEADGRIFIGCRTPARLLVLDAGTGREIASLDTVSGTDDLFYDAATHRIYVLGGGGQIVTYSQSGRDQYTEVNRLASGPGGRTGLFVPELKELLVAIPAQGSQNASLQVYQVQ
jgi:DNA-binding beta-propeller fold protein YncE